MYFNHKNLTQFNKLFGEKKIDSPIYKLKRF